MTMAFIARKIKVTNDLMTEDFPIVLAKWSNSKWIKYLKKYFNILGIRFHRLGLSKAQAYFFIISKLNLCYICVELWMLEMDIGLLGKLNSWKKLLNLLAGLLTSQPLGSVCCYFRVSLISGTAIATQVDFILIEL